jgi:hypothetical protein
MITRKLKKDREKKKIIEEEEGKKLFQAVGKSAIKIGKKYLGK